MSHAGRVYLELDPGQLLGVLELSTPWRDSRGQPIAPGVYSLRYALQPWIKDHLGTSEYRDFLLLTDATDDDGRWLPDASAESRSGELTITGHPAVVALHPVPPGMTSFPSLVEDEAGVVLYVRSGGQELGMELFPSRRLETPAGRPSKDQSTPDDFAPNPR